MNVCTRAPKPSYATVSFLTAHQQTEGHFSAIRCYEDYKITITNNESSLKSRPFGYKIVTTNI